MQKRAFITGVAGQDGSYLAELLLDKGYAIHGMVRPRSNDTGNQRIAHLTGRITLHQGDMLDSAGIDRMLHVIQPDEIYNLAAQSHVGASFYMPEYTAQTNAIGTLHLLEAVRRRCPDARFYQASTSELFGNAELSPQSEETPFKPRSPYAASKLYAHAMTVNYRQSYDMFACCGILFNHESERRGTQFVTRKITRAAARIKMGRQNELMLGNLDAMRDWGHAQDYVRAMWMMLQADKPDDYVIGTGETHSVRDFLDCAFGMIGLDWKRYVRQDPEYMRPSDVQILKGDAAKAELRLDWRPKINFHRLVERMVSNDLRIARDE